MVGSNAKDVFYEFGNGRKPRPTYKVLASHEARMITFRCIILKESTRLLVHLQYVVIMIHGNIPCQLSISFVYESRDDHIIGAWPYASNPITPISFVFRMTMREGRDAMRTVKLRSIGQVSNQFIQPFFGQHVGM